MEPGSGQDESKPVADFTWMEPGSPLHKRLFRKVPAFNPLDAATKSAGTLLRNLGIRCPEVAEEAAHEAVLRLSTSLLSRFENSGEPLRFFFATVKRCAFEAARALPREQFAEASLHDEEQEPDVHLRMIASSLPGPFESAVKREEEAILLAGWAHLTAIRRESLRNKCGPVFCSHETTPCDSSVVFRRPCYATRHRGMSQLRVWLERFGLGD